MSLTELALGRVAPSLLAPNEQVKQRGLEAVNAYRTKVRLSTAGRAAQGLSRHEL
jgi:hypothetical protein